MGHRFSKSATASASSNGTNSSRNVSSVVAANTNLNTSNRVSIPPSLAAGAPTINLQIQESPTTSRAQLSHCNSGSSTSVSNGATCPRQIIIKIQLAKMENGNEHQQLAQDTLAADAYLETDTNSNPRETGGILNVTLNRNFTTGTRTAGSSNVAVTSSSGSGQNNNFSRSATASEAHSHAYNALMERINSLHLNDELEQSTTESAEYCEVLEDGVAASLNQPANELLEEQEHLCAEEADVDNNNCCRRKLKSTSKRRCCKCTCRDAFRRILEPSSKSKERKELKQKHSSVIEHSAAWSMLPPATTAQSRPPQPRNILQRFSMPVLTSSSSVSHNSRPISIPANVNNSSAETAPNQQFSIWAPRSGNGGADVIIPISSPQQFVVVQCPPTSLVTLGRFDGDNAIRLTATEIVGAVAGDTITSTTAGMQQQSAALPTLVKATPNGPIVHSQVDFVHCLVPDLERITNSSFYWGKMDRYEAEQLLDGKPEGTFLLRDSAQEEFLFSVTFRKYGRSLHARIEQSGHKFSFDCHDPCVFTASTVTGLLEHYKDPACVMFFEPMLTMPLHRKSTFSLQQLCRATIVSHTSYDGITELELPTRLKAYLKEYHYKQKLRVKPFDEPFYTCT